MPLFGFASDVIFFVESAAKRVVAISGMTAGIGFVLDLWYQFLCSGVTATEFEVRPWSHILVVLSNELMRYLYGNVLPLTAVKISYIYILYTSTPRFPEGQFPHNTVIPDHDERQTSPKMATTAPPHIPW
jgi:hypothetical protein